jgi:hypothetical protein
MKVMPDANRATNTFAVRNTAAAAACKHSAKYVASKASNQNDRNSPQQHRPPLAVLRPSELSFRKAEAFIFSFG